MPTIKDVWIGVMCSHSSMCLTAAFARAWDITLVILAVVPIILAVGGTLSIFIGRITKEQSKAYGQANSIASEALAAIRTVLSFNGESRTIGRYSNSLSKPMLAGIKGGFFNGLLVGFSFFGFLGAFALALWYGGIRVRDGTYTGILLCVVFGTRHDSMSKCGDSACRCPVLVLLTLLYIP